MSDFWTVTEGNMEFHLGTEWEPIKKIIEGLHALDYEVRVEGVNENHGLLLIISLDGPMPVDETYAVLKPHKDLFKDLVIGETVMCPGDNHIILDYLMDDVESDDEDSESED
jgi:hypothetical protein